MEVGSQLVSQARRKWKHTNNNFIQTVPSYTIIQTVSTVLSLGLILVLRLSAISLWTPSLTLTAPLGSSSLSGLASLISSDRCLFLQSLLAWTNLAFSCCSSISSLSGQSLETSWSKLGSGLRDLLETSFFRHVGHSLFPRIWRL